MKSTNDDGVDIQYPWEDSPRRFHKHFMHIDAFDIDKYPVTNKEFKAFLDAAHYHPKDDLNFLRDWQGGSYPAGWGKQTCHMGFAGRCPGLCCVGREEASARMGMAILNAGG